MPLKFEGLPEQIRLVHSIAEEAYREHGETVGIRADRLHRYPVCSPISRIMVQKLRDAGYPASLRRFENPSGGLHIHVDLGNKWRSDAVWKQFLDNNRPTLHETDDPKVLVETKDALSPTLKRFGVKDYHLVFWESAELDPEF